MNREEKIPLGISSCLLGEPVRFDGGHKKNNYILDTLGQYFDYRSFCPEMAIGMGVPRPTIRLVASDADDLDLAENFKAVGVKDASLDVTQALESVADEQRSWHQQIFGYILKKDSPSCGMERVKLYSAEQANSPLERKGVGKYAAVLMRNFPNLPVEEEGRLCDPVLRENFVNRVFVYKRWRAISCATEEGNVLTWKAITDFHARLKWNLYSHDQNRARAVGSALAQKHRDPIAETCDWYESEIMDLLKVRATRKNHVNVLEHIRGYLKTHLTADEKAEIGESIEDYRLGLLPLIVPVTLLRHFFRKYPDPYIMQSWYLQPHPKQLMLLNQI